MSPMPANGDCAVGSKYAATLPRMCSLHEKVADAERAGDHELSCSRPQSSTEWSVRHRTNATGKRAQRPASRFVTRTSQTMVGSTRRHGDHDLDRLALAHPSTLRPAPSQR